MGRDSPAGSPIAARYRLLAHERWAADWVGKQRDNPSAPGASNQAGAQYGPEGALLLGTAIIADVLPGGVLIIVASVVHIAFQHQLAALVAFAVLFATGIGSVALGMARGVQVSRAGKRYRENNPFKE